MKRARESAAAQVCAARSEQVQARLLGSAVYRESATLVLYSSVGNEVATDAIFDHAIGSGRTVLYPRMHESGGERLTLHRIRARWELVSGAYGIPEPSRDAPECRASDLPACLVLVPGVAFSPDCSRLGRGGGHYDRLIARLGPQAITVGLAYSFQLLDRIMEDEWDQRLNFIITESAIYSAQGQWPEARQQGGNPR